LFTFIEPGFGIILPAANLIRLPVTNADGLRPGQPPD
jgi:hypothetical protein